MDKKHDVILLHAVRTFRPERRRTVRLWDEGPADWPTPILSDELLNAMGKWFVTHGLHNRGVRFITFCWMPELYGCDQRRLNYEKH